MRSGVGVKKLFTCDSCLVEDLYAFDWSSVKFQKTTTRGNVGGSIIILDICKKCKEDFNFYALKSGQLMEWLKGAAGVYQPKPLAP